MGGCLSSFDPIGRERSKRIDKQLLKDEQKYGKECKILLLGSGESGKSTIVKQMKIIHQSGFTKAELAEYTNIIYRNVVESAQTVMVHMRKFGMDCDEYANRVLVDKIIEFRLEDIPEVYLATEFAEAVSQVWKDPVIPKLMDAHGTQFYLMDSAGYFFNEVLRIGTPGYVPNEMDVLRSRQKTTGITQTRFTTGKLSIHMFDVGGQRSERKKWIHCFENVTSIIFCTSLSEYDQVLLEENSRNRMTESLDLFEGVINSRWFLSSSVILFLNKLDVLKSKLPKVPLRVRFPEYSGGTDVSRAAKYILWKFMDVNKGKLSVYPHLTQATDTSNVRVVFAAVKETILQNALRETGIL